MLLKSPRDLYQGIDMLYSSSTRRLKSEFVVFPAPILRASEVSMRGCGHRADESGADFSTRTEAARRSGDLPGGHWPAGSGKGAFRVSGDVVSFSVEEYDHSRELRSLRALLQHLLGR